MISVLTDAQYQGGDLTSMAKAQADRTGSESARKSAARLAAVQAVYQMRMSEQPVRDIVTAYIREGFHQKMRDDLPDMVKPDDALFSAIVRGAADRYDDLSEIIDTFLRQRNSAKANNSLESIDMLLGSAMLCGAYEIMAHHDIDAPIIINDYVEVTRAFYEGGEAGLVNAVLDNIHKAIRV